MFLDKIKELTAFELNVNPQELIYPPKSDWGDFSLPVFKKAQEMKLSPEKVGEDYKEKIFNNKKLERVIESSAYLGGYLNFFIKKEYLFKSILEDILKNKKKYGHNQSGGGNVNIFEYSNVNTHKDFHIGHLRNICFGDSIYKIALVNGFKASPVSYINDFGIHTAKAIWSYKKKYSENLNKCYANTVKKTKDDPLIVREVTSIMTDIEKRRGENYRLWKKTRKISLAEFNSIYKKLGVNFKKTYFESEVIKRGFKMVNTFIKKGIFKKSEGAIIADLEKYNLGILPIIRSDGTALYPVADLALIEKKSKDFKNLKNSYIIVDVRQKLYFQQLFKVLSLAGYKQNFFHLAYDFVTLPEGMMSSRSGNAVPFEKLYNKVWQELIIETRKRHPDWKEKKIEKNSDKLAIAILKFETLKISSNKIITFDIKEATKFDGFSALYILYGLARIKSILRKASFRPQSQLDYKFLNDKMEKELVSKLAKYPEIIIKSQKDYDPSEIAKYLFQLFQTFNEYYQKVKIIQAEEKTKKARLGFVYAVALVAQNALSLLGIDPLDEI